MSRAARFTTFATAFYVGVLALTLAGVALAGGTWRAVWGEGDGSPQALALSLLLGGAVGAALIAVSRVLEARWEAARRLGASLAAALPRLSGPQAAACAVSSSVAEEALFRGVAQPHLGLLAGSALFGLCHGGGRGELRLWALLAGVAGLVLGGLFQLTGTLLAPVVAHAALNFVNLRHLGNTP